jgi:hypothetical protein
MVKLNDIIKRNEIFTAKQHQAGKTFLQVTHFAEQTDRIIISLTRRYPTEEDQSYG